MKRAVPLALALAAIALGALPLAAPAQAPSVVATVEGSGEVTRAQFDHWLAIAAKSARLRRVPRPGTARYRDLRSQVMQLLIQNLWVAGEARARGIVVTDADVDRAFREQRAQSFPTRREFRRFLRTSGFTLADLRYRIRLEQTSNRVRAEVVRGAPPVTDEEVRADYEKHRSDFALPERRDVRYAVARTRAAAVARRKRLLRGATRGDLPAAVFRRRSGVVRSNGLWFAFRVVRVRPARQRSFEEVSEEIRGELEAKREQETLDAFIEDFQERWRAATTCRAAFATADCGQTTTS